jgi:hypothetical protein
MFLSSSSSPFKSLVMSEFKVIYLYTDYSIRSVYVQASSKDHARDLVFNRTEGCIKTLSAEFTN